ncbi:DAK2 domain fusion protein YloV [Gemelliphila asaccharolytica]|uniref:DAK2 domain fusion protein YloV n=2 Tax=Gemelliphila asaccharolytica TaxID=502393 RepID=A0ABR5TMV8_9BACL|nr:DAK2 domain fusion protein YloV [Gemella asaccharolytica]
MEKINGVIFAQMIDIGAKNLSRNAEKINALNVFPVPDGDTGTNMNLSMTSGANEVKKNIEESIGKVGKSFSKGLLMGARGNSGVILSQLFRGLSQYIEDKNEIDAKDFANSFKNGVDIAYEAVIKPVEGTILTVARESAEAGVKISNSTSSIIKVMEEILKVAEITLKDTPNKLPILKEVGVVDSGGQGLVCVYQGFLASLKGEEISNISDVQTNIVNMNFDNEHSKMDFISPEDIKYGYCTEFTVRLDKNKKTYNEKIFKEDLNKFGDSLLVISDNEYVKIHIHSEYPGNVFNYGQSYGELIKIKAENMREQHREVLKNRNNKEKKKYAIITVSMGSGLSSLFKQYGVSYVVEGGQTMNPSTEDILNAIKSVYAENIYILPNNKNVKLAAKQAAKLVSENVFVIESKSAPQGISALLIFDEEKDPNENYENMKNAIKTVKTLEITYAVRDTKLDGIEIKKSDYIGIIDDKIVCSKNNIKETLQYIINNSVDEDSEIITIYLGKDSIEENTLFLKDLISKYYPDVEIEQVQSQQPVYPYIISVE